MKTTNKIIAVSILAMLAVPAAQAKIVAETMLSEESGHYSSTHTVQSEINAKQDTANMETNTSSFNVDSTTKYPSMAVAQAMIEDEAGNLSENITGLTQNKQDKLTSTGTGANVVAGTATGNVVTSITASDGTVTINKASGAIKDVDIASDAAIAKTKLASGVQTSLGKADSALQSVTANSNSGVVTNISKSGTAVTMTKALIKNADVASDAAIAVSKIDGAEATANKSNAANVATDAAGTSADTKYPTVAAAKSLAETAAANAVSGAAGNYATAAQGAKADTALQSVTANSGSGVVTNISKSGTAVTMTKAQIKNADVADNAAIAVSKISGAEATANKSTSTNAVADSTGSNKDTKYPTVAGAKAIADAAVSGAAGNYATAAQGALADTALQKADITTGSANGTIAVDGTDVSVKGLGTAAYTASTAYATSAQGGKADTALQSVTANSDGGVVTNISKSGTAITMTKAKIANADVADNAAIAVSKISGAEASANKSTSTTAVADSTGSSKDTKYPTVAGAKAIADAAVSGAAGNYATAEQGAKADSAVQSVTLASGTNNGTVKLTVDGTTTDNIAVKGLGSAAYKTASDTYGATSANVMTGKAVASAISGKQDNLGGTNDGGKLVVTTTTAGTVTYTNAVPTAIPQTPSTDGVFVLTAKNANGTTTFYWEDIGR